MKKIWNKLEWRISIFYLIFGFLWILFSDTLLTSLVPAPEIQRHLQLYKGWFFVLFSALLIFFVVRSSTKKQKESKIRELEFKSWFQELFETSLEGILLTSPTGEIFAANPAACRLLLRSEEEIIRLGRDGIMDTTDPRLGAALKERQQTGTFAGEMTMLRGDGSKIEVEMSSVIFTDQFGNQRTNIIIHDLTERKKRELELVDINSRFSQVLDSISEALVILDHNWRVVYVNKAGARIFNKSADELTGKNHWEEWPATIGTTVEEKIRWAMSNRKSVRFESHYIKKGEYDVWLSIHVYPYQAGLAIFYADVTAKKKADEALRKLNRELETKVKSRTAELELRNRELETFTYSVSHDLKAPLRGIDGYSRLLLEQYKSRLDEEGQFFLENIRRAAGQMSQLIDDLLQYSRLERRSIALVPMNLQETIERLLQERQKELASFQFELSLDLQCRDLRTDSDGLVFALRNLIDNAIKFSSSVENPRLKIESRKTKNSCVIVIEDNGIGFDMKFSEKIFEIFQRLHRSEEYPGTGIGLAIVSKVMERLGGRAWAESEPGKGAKFYLEVPL